MLSILGFMAVLGPLVVVHELGHFLFARWFGVKAEVFSVGFGPTLAKKRWGETEYRLSWLPLGGYVKLLGAEPEEELRTEDLKRALHRQDPWKRFFIFFGGPLFNFLFAILVFMMILVIGEQQVASVVGRVLPGSVAEQAGFRPGDRIVAIQGQPVRKFEEVASVLHGLPNQKVDVSVLREEAAEDSVPVIVTVSTKPEAGYTIYGEEVAVGTIDGILPMARSTVVGVSDPYSVAGRAGVRTGDKVVTLNGVPIQTWEQLERRVSEALIGARIELGVQSKEKIASVQTLEFVKKASSDSLGSRLGLHSSEMFVEKIMPDSPAAAAAIQAGDRILEVDGIRLTSFYALKDAIQVGGQSRGNVQVRWEREGKVFNAEIVPTATQSRDPLLKKQTTFTIGIVPQLVWSEPKYVTERILNPFKLVYAATKRMAVFSWRNIVSIRKMITGDVSVATLGGPILIGKIAGESISRGLIAFLTTMAVLSVGLGVLNILPVPVLDGGHLLLLGIEMVRGKPLTLRQMEIVQQVGLSLIVLLMVVVMKNDLSRLPIFN